ncbi:hypothetical protein [Paenibacillus oenotherae]|nr:hypothetical protein [Paenibacillus oenotherae]
MKWIGKLILIAAILIVGGIFVYRTFESPVNTYTVTMDGMTMPAVTGKQYLQLFDENKMPHDILLKGVNMGIAKPGHFPGETAISKDEYRRWFEQIGAMNANVIRVYTLHPPGFYEALAEYNAKAKHPLYLLHGTWINEDKLGASQDAYDPDLNKEFIQEIHRIIDVIHGEANIAAQPGHASGQYRADISKYVLGWVLGVEWNPAIVKATNDKHSSARDFEGRYFKTAQASPFENWLAGIMEETVSYEASRYSWQRPISFTNWVTTDLLDHPSEPLPEEDMVSVNPNVIEPTTAFHAGYFASYHVYPYYPDFLNYETKYTEYKNQQGAKDSYAGYLNDLRKAHRMPVVIAEFGVPSSRGMTHRNIYGWNQGAHSEQEQGEIDARLFENIRNEGMAGGLVFSWQDEWFKRTWNTMELDDPDRRPFWSNAQTSEQQFGLLSFDPGNKPTIQVDGETGDWDKAGIASVPMQSAGPVKAAGEDYEAQKLEQWYVASDERYVYFRLDFGKDNQPFDWSKTGTMLLLDTIQDQGQHQLPGGSGLKTEAGIDFVIDLKGPNKSRLVVDSYYDPFYYEYGELLNLLPKQDHANQKNNGVFHKSILALNRPLDVPNVHGQTLHLPLDSYETGLLIFGDGNPDHPAFHSLTDVSYNEKAHTVELRIPWQLLNMKDPSTREAMGDIWKEGLEGKTIIPGIKIAAVTYRPDSTNSPDEVGGSDLIFSTAGISEGQLLQKDMAEYSWNTWEVPTYHERLKQSYYILQNLFRTAQPIPAQ